MATCQLMFIQSYLQIVGRIPNNLEFLTSFIVISLDFLNQQQILADRMYFQSLCDKSKILIDHLEARL